MKSAVGYVRVSSTGQVGGHGFQRQEDEIKLFAKGAGIKVGAIYREEVSGTTDESERPAFTSMIEDLLGNGCRTVIVEGLDRIARTLAVQEQLVAYLASKGIELFNARTGVNVTEDLKSDPMKAAMIRIQGVFSQLEKELLVKKLKKARDAIKEKTGKCGGRNGLKELNPEALKRIKSLKNAGVKYSFIANELNTAGLLTSMGKTWDAGLVQAAVFRHL